MGCTAAKMQNACAGAANDINGVTDIDVESRAEMQSLKDENQSLKDEIQALKDENQRSVEADAPPRPPSPHTHSASSAASSSVTAPPPSLTCRHRLRNAFTSE